MRLFTAAVDEGLNEVTGIASLGDAGDRQFIAAESPPPPHASRQLIDPRRTGCGQLVVTGRRAANLK